MWGNESSQPLVCRKTSMVEIQRGTCMSVTTIFLTQVLRSLRSVLPPSVDRNLFESGNTVFVSLDDLTEG